MGTFSGLNLGKNVKITRVLNATAAGTDDTLTSSAIDMQGFDTCLFLAAFGTLTASAVTSIKVQQSDDDGVADGYSDLTGTSVAITDDRDNDCIWVEVTRPSKRYLKLIVTRATANAVVDGVFAFQGAAETVPVTHDTATIYAGEVHVSPEEGTA